MNEVRTADLCDAYESELQVAAPLLRSYGGVRAFSGLISTVRVYADNVLVRAALEEKGRGRVLVVDGGGSLRYALFGDRLAQLAQENGWNGIVVYGCIRDAQAIAAITIGVQALATCPRKSVKRGEGERDILVSFADVVFQPGHYLYADDDGIIVAERELDT